MPTERFDKRLKRYVDHHGTLPYPDPHHLVYDVGAPVQRSVFGAACFVCGAPVPHITGCLDWELGVALHKADCFPIAQEILRLYKDLKPWNKTGQEWVRVYILKERLLAFARESDVQLYGEKCLFPHGLKYHTPPPRRL